MKIFRNQATQRRKENFTSPWWCFRVLLRSSLRRLPQNQINYKNKWTLLVLRAVFFGGNSSPTTLTIVRCTNRYGKPLGEGYESVVESLALQPWLNAVAGWNAADRRTHSTVVRSVSSPNINKHLCKYVIFSHYLCSFRITYHASKVNNRNPICQ